MHKNKKKVTFSGSLAWRTSIVCLLFLIIPLLIHTLFLYFQEIRIVEADVNFCTKAIGKETAERIYQLQKTQLLWRLITFFALILFLGGGLVIWFIHKLGKPLQSLCMTMKRVAEGAVHSRYVPQRWGFEINAIGKMFNEVLDEMLLSSKEAEEERMKRVRLVEELKLGREIQESLLPKTFPNTSHLEISAGCIPAQEVGGDFYDIFPLGEEKTLIAVADVSGKGISACLFSLGLRSSLRALAANVDSLPEIVKEANALFLSDAEQSSNFATLWIGIIEKKKFSFISLGHPPALLKRGGTLKELTTPYPALGLVSYEEIRAASIDLEPGDEILIFSDGATDARDVEGERYGLERLKGAFLRSREILKEIERFSHGVSAQDDLTLLFVRII